MMEELMKLAHLAKRQGDAQDPRKLYQNPKKLKECIDYINKKRSFKAGDFIKFGKYMNNRTMMGPNHPCIVLKVLPAPITGTDDPDSPYYGEKLDLIVGYFNLEGLFTSLYIPSDRMELYPKDELLKYVELMEKECAIRDQEDAAEHSN